MSKPPGHIAVNLRPKRKKFWRIALWLLFGFLFLAFLILYWVWANRLSLVETEIKNQLKEAGFDVELSLKELTETFAEVEDLTVFKDGKKLLEAGSVEVDYDWREAMEGQFKKVKMISPKLVITIDEIGQIKNPLGSGGVGGGASAPEFPPGGIHIEKGRVEIQSSVGDVTTLIEGQIFSPENIDVRLSLDPSELAYGDLSGTVSGDVDVTIKGQERTTEFDLQIPVWRYKNMSGTGLSVIGAPDIQVTDMEVGLSGRLSARLEKFKGKAAAGQNIDVDWQGDIGITRGERSVLLAKGDWSVLVDSFGVTDQNTRLVLAETITLQNSLERTPVTRDFAKPLKSSVVRLLKSGRIAGAGRVDKNVETTVIELTSPVTWNGAQSRAVLAPDPVRPEYHFSRAAQELQLHLDLEHDGIYPLMVDNGHLVFRSTNGRNIKGTKSFKGQVRLPRSWDTKTPEGRPSQIRPLSAIVDYKGGDGPRHLSLTGHLDYDGDIPGGYARALNADGRLDVGLGDSTEIYFTPRDGEKITMQSFDNPTEWTASNVSFNLDNDPAKPFFKTRNQIGQLSTSVSNLRADLANDGATRTLELAFGEADITANIANAQSWIIEGRDVRMTSENTPSAGTVMTTPAATITARLVPGELPEFTIDAPSADVRTNAVDAKGLAVQVAGTPERFRVDYQNGDVEFSATDFPAFDMTGHVNFENDQWTGQANSFLPFDGETPTIIDYRFIDGLGYAEVDIPEMQFSPSGLQPQGFIPALQGKIADVSGAASAKISLEFSDEGGVKSSGSAKLFDLDMGTAPGPLRGLNSELTFSSFFPLVTDGPQTAVIKAWDVGFPLPEGVIEFEAITDGIEILSARWPVGDGAISLDPATWSYTAPENRMRLRVADVSLGQLIGDLGGKNFQATGNVSGVLPIVISGVDVQVEDGTLAVTNGGVVRFSTPFTDKAGETNGYAQLAFDALKEFYYEELEVTLNGPLDGLINVRIVFEGFNPNVMDGAYIRYNVNIEGELLNIVRNFQRLGAQITDEVKKAVLGDEVEE